MKYSPLITNAFSNWTSLSINAAVSFFLTPFIISHIGMVGFGIWSLTLSIAGYYGLLDLGVTTAITRYIALYESQKDFKSQNETISTALGMFCGLGGLIILLSLFLAGPLSNFFNVPAADVNDFSRLIWLLGVSAAISLPGNVCNAALRAQERFVPANGVIIAMTLLRTGLVIFLLSRNLGLLGVAYATLATSVAALISNFWLCYAILPHFKPRIMDTRWSMLRILLSYGLTTTVIALADILRFKLDSIVIGKWVSLSGVGVFSIAALITQYMTTLVINAVNVTSPRLVALHAQGEGEPLRQLFLKALSISAFLGVGMGTVIAILGRRFIILWVGPDFLEAVPVLWTLLLCCTIGIAQFPGILAMYALNKHRFLAATTVVEGVANLVLSIMLAPRYGLIGVAFGTAIPMLLVKILVQPVYVCRILGVSLYRYWGQLAPKMLLSAGLIIISIYFPHLEDLEKGFFSLVAAALAFSLAFGLLYMITDFRRAKRYT
jgi:O-antigen/teichoic acid export membrane protein